MNDIPTDAGDGTGQYEIRLRGHLEPRWAAWFDGMSLTSRSDGTTTLTGPVVDQAALHGLLQRVRDAGLALVSITQIDPHQPSASIITQQQSPTTPTRRTT